MDIKADLHVHSNYSDGFDSVENVLKQAKKNGVTHISFVDHDTVDGLLEVQRLGEIYDMTTIPGVEISAYDFKRERKVHILGYDYHPAATHIKALCEPLLRRRQEHTLWQMQQIRSLGYELDEAKILESALPSNTIYKQHIMQQLTNASYDSLEYKQLYQSLFKNDGVASGDIVYVDAFDAVEAIVLDGGLAVVAHPGQLDSYEIIPELVEVGLAGVERNHLEHNEVDFLRVEAIAKEYDLYMTGGTDYHGNFGTSVHIGDVVSPINPLLKNCKTSKVYVKTL